MGKKDRTLLGCALAYGGAYLSRHNLSAALPAMITSLGLTEASGGMAQTLFALCYAAGQFAAGAVADRVDAKLFIRAGLLASALANISIAAFGSFYPTVALCAVNGLAQSMLWTPIVKLISLSLSSGERESFTFRLFAYLVGAHVAAWALAGFLAEASSWRAAFAVPGALTLCFAAFAPALIRAAPSAPRERGASEAGAPIGAMLFGTGLAWALLAGATNGFVRDGIASWGPTILSGEGGANSVALSLLIPALNLAGIALGKAAHSLSRRDARKSVAALALTGGAFALSISFFTNAPTVVVAASLGCAFACMNGLNPMLATMIPLEYAGMRRVGLAAGMIDCFIYLGSALSGSATGSIAGAAGWGSVFAVWAGASAAGAALILLSGRRAPRNGPAKP